MEVLRRFLETLKEEEESLDNLTFDELSQLWKKSAPNSEFRKRIDRKLFLIISQKIEGDYDSIVDFFEDLVSLSVSLSPDSKNESLVLRRMRELLKEEKREELLLEYYFKLSSFSKGSYFILLKIKEIWSKKRSCELIALRSDLKDQSLVGHLDQIILDKLPNDLRRNNSASELLKILSLLPYNSRIKDMVEERLVSIFESNFLFSVFSFEKLYIYWKSFSNKSKGQKILFNAIKNDVEGNSLEKLYKKLSLVDVYDVQIRNLLLNDLVVKIYNLEKKNKEYQVFLDILYQDIRDKSIPQELLPIITEKVKTFLETGA